MKIAMVLLTIIYWIAYFVTPSAEPTLVRGFQFFVGIILVIFTADILFYEK
jgi:hypothetical protein